MLNLVREPEIYKISLPNYAVGGNYVAYFAYSGVDGANANDTARIHVLNVRSGDQKQIDYGVLTDAATAFSVQVTSKGSVAFSSCTGPADTVCEPSGTLAVPTDPEHSPVLQRYIAVVDSRGARVLDMTPTLDYLSLRRKGSTLTWRDGANVRTATIR